MFPGARWCGHFTCFGTTYQKEEEIGADLWRNWEMESEAEQANNDLHPWQLDDDDDDDDDDDLFRHVETVPKVCQQLSVNTLYNNAEWTNYNSH
jgi:hypothetical protein